MVYQISQAAEATGFSVSALRYYEKEGVVVPQRTSSGYRSYRKEDIEDLRFVARAKYLGLTLPEITELLALLRDEECRTVQTRMRQLVSDHIAEAQQQISDLVAFTGQLQQAAFRLGVHTAEGACDERCGCRSEPVSHEQPATAVPLAGDSAPDIACTLSPALMQERIEDWKTVADEARAWEPIADGVRLRFGRGVDLAALAQLAADEQTCCGFFTFMVGIHSDAVTLDVTGPAEAQPVISAMFGTAA